MQSTDEAHDEENPNINDISRNTKDQKDRPNVTDVVVTQHEHIIDTTHPTSKTSSTVHQHHSNNISNNSANEETSEFPFEPLDPEKESKIEYVKLPPLLLAAIILCTVALFTWIIIIIASMIQHSKTEGSIKYGFCDGIDSCVPFIRGTKSINDHKCKYCIEQNYAPNQCWDKALPSTSFYFGWCAPFNNESSAIFWFQLLFMMILCLWCYKGVKMAWKGIRLPVLEKQDDAKQKGYKRWMNKINDISDKVYDLKIDLRKLVQLYTRYTNCNDRTKEDENMEHDDFLKMMGNGIYILFIMRYLLIRIPLLVLNITSTSFVLRLEGVAGLLAFVTELTLEFCCGGCCKKNQTETFEKNKTPKPNWKFLHCFHNHQQIIGSDQLFTIFLSLLFGWLATPRSNYDCWMRSITVFKGIYMFCSHFGRMFSYTFVMSSYYQKPNVSLRESLLMRDYWRKCFSLSIFKVSITDQDKFVYVDENIGSSAFIAAEAQLKCAKELIENKKKGLCVISLVAFMMVWSVSILLFPVIWLTVSLK